MSHGVEIGRPQEDAENVGASGNLIVSMWRVDRDHF
jgi:hypothetical protein